MKLMKPIVGLAALAPAALIIRSEIHSERRSEHTMNAVNLIYKPVMKWAAHRALVGRNRSRHEPEQGRFTRADVDHIIDETWQNFEQLAPSVPREPTVGNRMVMLLACMTASCFRSLMAAGVERDYAIELFADIAWQVYEKSGILLDFIARLATHDSVEQMRMRVNMFLRFPFNSPGYIFERVPADPSIGLGTGGGIAFNMLRCPAAEYFQSLGMADLCVSSWCNLDYGLAEMWGGRLERTGTLAGGDERCDFRFITTARQ
jgi:ubiquinone biosynthesis protein